MRKIKLLCAGVCLASNATVWAASYSGNGNTGFAGPIGNGTLEITHDSTNLHFTLVRGPGGDLNDFLVLYLDTKSGGFTNTAGFFDDFNASLVAASGWSSPNQSVVQFPTGFAADLAITVDATSFDGAGLYALATGGILSHQFLTYSDMSGAAPSDTSFTWSLPLSALNLEEWDTFQFVGTYLNGANAFRSDEAFGDGIPPGNPGTPSLVTFTSSLAYALASTSVLDTINFQGRLTVTNQLANGIFNVEFRLFNTNVGGVAVYAETQTVSVADGLYAVQLGTAAPVGMNLRQVVMEQPTFLEVTVSGQALSPREPLSSVPYAMLAAGVRSQGISSDMIRNSAVTSDKIASGAVGSSALASNAIGTTSISNRSITTLDINFDAITATEIASGAVSNFEIAANAITGNKIVDGTISNADLSAQTLSNTFWRLAGNAGTTPGTHFLGTTDHRALEIRANNLQAVLITPSNGAPNIVLGSAQNSIAVGTRGASILGGSNNTIALNSDFSIVVGGGDNRIGTNSISSAIGGGIFNSIGANSGSSAIGGGFSNTIESNAPNASIPGGQLNIVGVGAANAFAAGRQAKANHRGTFVWADDQGVNFTSTADNQFLIRASGGVGIGIVSPTSTVHIRSAGNVGDAKITIEADADNNDENDNPEIFFSQDGGGAFAFIAMEGEADTRATNTLANALLIGSEDNNPAVQFLTDDAVRMTILTGGNVGIGTSTPTNKLHVAGTVQATAYITGSDRDSKENIQPVSVDEVLAKVVNLPMATWTFKDDDSGTHIGPMAQDFHAAFNLGNTDSGIFTVDADGVALAAIQALARENAELRARLERLERTIGKTGNP